LFDDKSELVLHIVAFLSEPMLLYFGD